MLFSTAKNNAVYSNSFKQVVSKNKWFQKTSGFKKQIEPDHHHKQL